MAEVRGRSCDVPQPSSRRRPSLTDVTTFRLESSLSGSKETSAGAFSQQAPSQDFHLCREKEKNISEAARDTKLCQRTGGAEGAEPVQRSPADWWHTDREMLRDVCRGMLWLLSVVWPPLDQHRFVYRAERGVEDALLTGCGFRSTRYDLTCWWANRCVIILWIYNFLTNRRSDFKKNHKYWCPSRVRFVPHVTHFTHKWLSAICPSTFFFFLNMQTTRH